MSKYLDAFVGSLMDRETSKATGGILGSIAGATQGAKTGLMLPVPPPLKIAGGVIGATTGAILGATGAGQVNDIVKSLLEGDELSAQKQWDRLGSDFKTEATWQTIFAKVPAIKPLFAKLFGGSQKSREAVAEVSERTGVPFGISDVPDAKAAGLYKRVVGIFPFVRSPFSKTIAKRTQVIEDKKDQLLNLYAPNASLSDLGIEMYKNAGKKFNTFKSMSNRRYELWKDTAKKLDLAFIPTINVKREAQKLIDDVMKSPIESPRKDLFFDYLEKVTKLDGTLKIDGYEAIVKDLESLVKTGYDVKRLKVLKKALEDDLDSFSKVLLPKGQGAMKVNPLNLNNEQLLEAEKLVRGYEDAKQFYANGIKLFQKPSSKMFEKADPNIFKTGYTKYGSISPDALAEKIIKKNLSPSDLADLRQLIGDDSYSKLTRKVLDDAFNSATVSQGDLLSFDPNKVESFLGITGKKQFKNETLQELLKTSKVNPQQFMDFLEVSKLHADQKIADLSQFLVRRGTLGGVGSLFGTATMGTSIGANPFVAVPLIFTARSFGNFLNNPKNLKLATTALDPKSSRYNRYFATLNLIDASLRSDDTLNEVEKDNLLEMKKWYKDNRKDLIKGNIPEKDMFFIKTDNGNTKSEDSLDKMRKQFGVE